MAGTTQLLPLFVRITCVIHAFALTVLLSVVLGGRACADEVRAADALGIPWDRSLFNYTAPARLAVEETTPTDAQVNFWIRPPQADASAALPKETGPARPRLVGGVDIVHLRFVDAVGDIVPALLCTPSGKKGPFPLVIAVHGLTSNKTQVCAQVTPALVKRGYAVIAADLPCHGERPGNPLSLIDGQHWRQTFPLYRKAVIDIHQLIDLAAARANLDTKGGVVLVGYSLGSWISGVAGPSDDRVRAMVLMVGGALDTPAEALKEPRVAAIDPRVSIPHFAGRPLLLLNGRTDTIVHPDWSKRLYAACAEPKEQIWYDSGHLLPEQAFEDAARWIVAQAKK